MAEFKECSPLKTTLQKPTGNTMHILCTICSDIVNQAESLYVTKCGHLFHHHCLSQWIERSKTCPQCRNKVSGSCMWRVYPTAAAAAGAEDAAALQARLDDALLAAREAARARSEAERSEAAAAAARQASEEVLRATEKKLVSREVALAAVKEQLTYAQAQARDAARLQDDNDRLTGTLQTLQGLQRVLSAGEREAEELLAAHADANTLALFATALKKALGAAEAARRAARARLQEARAALAAERAAHARARERAAHALKMNSEDPRVRKRKSADSSDDVTHADVHDDAQAHKQTRRDAPAETRSPLGDLSMGSLVARIEAADSPYLRLRAAPPALSALCALSGAQSVQCAQSASTAAATTQHKHAAAGSENRPSTSDKQTKPSAIKADNAFSIFHSKPQTSPLDYFDITSTVDPDVSYDGLGGHAKLDAFPKPRPGLPAKKSCVPRLSAKHKLKRTASNYNIGEMLDRINSKNK